MSRLSILVFAAAIGLAGLGGGQPPPPAETPVVVAGFKTTCVLGGEHRLTCYGQAVGDGTGGAHFAPVATNLGQVKAVALSAFLPFGCAIVGDPTTGPAGPVSCWIDSGAPTPVPGISDARAISVGGPGACAVLAADASVRCWSLTNPFGTNNYVSPFFPSTPSSVRGLQTGVVQVSVGQHFACAVQSTDSRVYCWGRNDAGQLGRGSVGAATDPELDASVPVVGLQAKQVAAGTDHACAIAGDDTVKCWGDSTSGQLGNGKNATSFVPTPQVASGIAAATGVSASAAYTCAVLADRTARCWGQNLPTVPYAGTLGVGRLPSGSRGKKPDRANTPLPVKGLTGAMFISTGGTHACASGFPLSVHCWGTNSVGELAINDDTVKGSLEPVPK